MGYQGTQEFVSHRDRDTKKCGEQTAHFPDSFKLFIYTYLMCVLGFLLL